jgi:tight adherence protein B
VNAAIGVVVGLLLGLGLMLLASPFLWPMSGRRSRATARPFSRLRDRLAQAGISSVSPTGVIVVAVLFAMAVSAVTVALIPVPIIALIAGAVALSSPFALISWRARSRRAAARVLWPDVVDHLVSAVRSGLALPDSVEALAHTGPMPTRTSFAVFESEYRATGNFSVALDGLKSRLADPVADRILETLRMAREVGGSELITVLRHLSAYLRQEAAIRSEVEARQSWVMNAAKLGVAAPWIILLLLATRPEAAEAYSTGAGVALIVAGLLVTSVAYRIMLAIGHIPEERRWFA